jgi:hypothetical protein
VLESRSGRLADRSMNRSTAEAPILSWVVRLASLTLMTVAISPSVRIKELFWQNGPWYLRCLIRPYGRLCLQPGAGAVGQPLPGIAAGADLELDENFAQVVLDRPGRQE